MGAHGFRLFCLGQWSASAVPQRGHLYPSSVTGNLHDLSDQGDQLFAFHGRLDSVVLLAGIHFNGNGWEFDRLDPHTSACPSAIANHAIGLTETDNGFYTGLRTGHALAQYQHWITDQHNSWLLFDTGQIHQRPNTDRFVFFDPVFERANELLAADDDQEGEASGFKVLSIKSTLRMNSRYGPMGPIYIG